VGLRLRRPAGDPEPLHGEAAVSSPPAPVTRSRSTATSSCACRRYRYGSSISISPVADTSLGWATSALPIGSVSLPVRRWSRSGNGLAAPAPRAHARRSSDEVLIHQRPRTWPQVCAGPENRRLKVAPTFTGHPLERTSQSSRTALKAASRSVPTEPLPRLERFWIAASDAPGHELCLPRSEGHAPRRHAGQAR